MIILSVLQYDLSLPISFLFHTTDRVCIDGYIIAGIDIAGLGSEFAIWCGLLEEDSWYNEITSMQYALEIVDGNTCCLQKLWTRRTALA
jgi:hypothetical protein